MTKKELRRKYKTLRSSLTADQIEAQSLAIANQSIVLPIWNGLYYHLFLPITEKKEVDTEFLLQVLAGKDKEIVISKSDFEHCKMTHYLLTDNTRIQKNEFHIPEPVDGIEVPVTKIDVVFVPLLAFDTSGNRIGYGKGFYDQFLSECRPETLKIGVSFFNAEPVITDIYENDIRLDYCITPDRVYKF